MVTAGARGWFALLNVSHDLNGGVLRARVSLKVH